jgi:hypothetical protein
MAFYDLLRIHDPDFYREGTSAILPRRDRCLFVTLMILLCKKLAMWKPCNVLSFNFYGLENLTECRSFNYCKQKLVAIKLCVFKCQQFYCKVIRFMGIQHRHSRVIGTRVLGTMYGSQKREVSDTSER